MAILQPFLIPTVGDPQPIIARRRLRSRMIDPELYQMQQEQQPPSTEQQSGPTQPQQLQFTKPPPTEQYIQEQLQRVGSRAEPPKLEPGARVRSANMELTQPSNFQQFYEQLSTINRMGDEMLGAAQARAAFRRMQALTSVGSQTASSSSGGRARGGGGQDFGGGIPSNPQANFRFAQEVGPKFGWTGPELNAWYTLGMKESGWRNTAQNPTSTAYGIGQFLNSTWRGVGISKTSDPRMQVEAMARYIRNRYGSPSRALAFHRSHNWY